MFEQLDGILECFNESLWKKFESVMEKPKGALYITLKRMVHQSF